ncbi:coiled-coil domain-containing protein 66-like isoform X2 [Panonychus citri]|uniref:coiled-coil domain-containing protein 66-like isoform X2 n=1 Tax=Panonychus citri TaxID=50023 RepID=UPI0023081C99|nr:coiled-coil domain-containing protein 66-like isoform X2 [Panonychus citri]
MDNITLNKNQVKVILELVNQIGSNRSQNLSVTSLTPTWERRSIDNSNGNDYFIKQTCDGDDNQITPKTMEKVQSNDEKLFLKIENGNDSKPVEHENINRSIPQLEYSYPYFSHSISNRPLIKSQSLGAIECSPLLSPLGKDSTSELLSRQLVTASSISSLIPPRTAPSPSHSLVSFGSTQGETVNFRRYTRSVTSSLGGIISPNDDWEEKRRKMLQYRAELSAQREEKARREREEKEKVRAEEEAAERRMVAVQLRLKEEYELERRLIEEKRETIEKRRLAVIAAMEQSKGRGRLRKDNDQLMNYSNRGLTTTEKSSVSTQTDNYIDRQSTNTIQEFTSNRSTSNCNHCSSSSQTDISLLFDLIRSLGFSTMTLKGTTSDDEDDERDATSSRYKNGLRSTIRRLNKTAKARLGRNGLKFDLNENPIKTIESESNTIKRNLSKSASHTNLNRIGKLKPESNQDKSVNHLKGLSSSSSNLLTNEIKPTKLKGIINHKKQSISNLPLINDNQLNFNLESISTIRKATKSTLEGIL